MKKLYLIGGPMGVGKTAACQCLKRMLPNSLFLDGDWCWDSSPFQVTEETKAMVLDNICHLLNNALRCSAYEHVIFCWVLHERAILQNILSRLDTSGCAVRAVSLICDPDTLRSRLQRDIGAGLRTADIIPDSLGRLPLYDRLGTVRIDVSALSPGQTAERIAAL